MDDYSCLFSLLAALAFVATAIFEVLGNSVQNTPTERYASLVILLVGMHSASAGFALGVASLHRSVGSTKAWVGAVLGASALLLEAGYLMYAYSHNI
jgi:uncharacterized membrane protein